MKKEIISGFISGFIVLILGISFNNYKEHNYEILYVKTFMNEFRNVMLVNNDFLNEYKGNKNIDFDEIMKLSYSYTRLEEVDTSNYNPIIISKYLNNYSEYLKVNKDLKTINLLLKQFQDSCIYANIPTSNAFEETNQCMKKSVTFTLVSTGIIKRILKNYTKLIKLEPVIEPRIISINK